MTTFFPLRLANDNSPPRDDSNVKEGAFDPDFNITLSFIDSNIYLK